VTIVLIAALVSVVMGFVFALVESALGRVTRHRVVALAEEGHAGASALGRIVDNHATALMVLTFLRVGAEMTAAVLVTVAATRAFDGAFWPSLATASPSWRSPRSCSSASRRARWATSTPTRWRSRRRGPSSSRSRCSHRSRGCS